MFGKNKIKVIIDDTTEIFDADDIVQIIRERNQAREQRNQIIAKHDELKWKVDETEERLERANAKLKSYGHPGDI